MTEDLLFSSSGGLTLVLLVVALGIFASLTAKSRNFKSFQFQISLFIVIWIIGEVVDLLGEEGVIRQFATSQIATYIHATAMAMFSAMLWARFLLSQKRGSKMADSLQES